MMIGSSHRINTLSLCKLVYCCLIDSMQRFGQRIHCYNLQASTTADAGQPPYPVCCVLQYTLLAAESKGSFADQTRCLLHEFCTKCKVLKTHVTNTNPDICCGCKRFHYSQTHTRWLHTCSGITGSRSECWTCRWQHTQVRDTYPRQTKQAWWNQGWATCT